MALVGPPAGVGAENRSSIGGEQTSDLAEQVASPWPRKFSLATTHRLWARLWWACEACWRFGCAVVGKGGGEERPAAKDTRTTDTPWLKVGAGCLAAWPLPSRRASRGDRRRSWRRGRRERGRRGSPRTGKRPRRPPRRRLERMADRIGTECATPRSAAAPRIEVRGLPACTPRPIAAMPGRCRGRGGARLPGQGIRRDRCGKGRIRNRAALAGRRPRAARRRDARGDDGAGGVERRVRCRAGCEARSSTRSLTLSCRSGEWRSEDGTLLAWERYGHDPNVRNAEHVRGAAARQVLAGELLVRSWRRARRAASGRAGRRCEIWLGAHAC